MEGMHPHELEQLAAQLLHGELSAEDFLGRVQRPTIADVGEAQIDLDRHRRCGFPEVVFAEGKTVAAMEKIFQAQIAHGIDVLATRMSAEQAAELLAKFPPARYNPIGPDVSHLRDGPQRGAAAMAGDEAGPGDDRHGRHQRSAGGRGGPGNGPVDRGRGER